MQKITFPCPSCKSPLTVPESAASATGTCPTCNTVITGPGLDPERVATAQEESEEEPVPEEPAAGEQGSDRSHARPVSGGGDEVLPAPESTPRRLGLGVAVTLCLISSMACLAIGYQLGRSAGAPPVAQSGPPKKEPAKVPDSGAPKAPTSPSPAALNPDAPNPAVPIVATQTPIAPAPPLPVTPPPDDPVIEPTPPAIPNPPKFEATTPDKAALLAFLTAPDWNSRQVHVLHAEEVLAEMEAFATERGDGPIEFTSIGTLHQSEDTAIFEVSTKEHPNGFPVALSKTASGWRVDWSGFAEFRYSLFRAFVSGDSDPSGTFRLLLKPMLADASDATHQPYAATPPDDGEEIILLAPEDSPIYQELEDTIGALAAKSPGSFRNFMKTGGIPFVLRVSKTNEEGKARFLIEEVISRGWAPKAP